MDNCIISIDNVIQSIMTIGFLASLFYLRKQIRIGNEANLALKKQQEVLLYADFTKRYQEIILNFPENINYEFFNYHDLDEKERNKTYRYMRIYFDLCSEEFHLNDKNLIDKNTFEFWRKGMEYALTKTAFKKAWGRISRDSDFHDDFKHLAGEITGIKWERGGNGK